MWKIQCQLVKLKYPKIKKLKVSKVTFCIYGVMQILFYINYSLAAKFWDVIVFKFPFFLCLFSFFCYFCDK